MRQAALLLLVTSIGCAKLLGYTDGGQKANPIPSYPDGIDGLRSYASDVLEAARKDDRERVHDLLANAIMTDADLTALFGAEAGDLAPRYHKLMETLVNRGGVELVAQVYERKLDNVEVIAIERNGSALSPVDKAIATSLKTPITWYSVRFKKATDARGLRYDFFFYRNGRWLTGNQIGTFLSSYHPVDGGAH